MRTTIDRAGRMVVPKTVRDDVGLPNGGEVEIGVRDGRIEVEPVGLTVHLQELDGHLVFVSEGSVEQLTVEDVRAVLDRLRR